MLFTSGASKGLDPGYRCEHGSVVSFSFVKLLALAGMSGCHLYLQFLFISRPTLLALGEMTWRFLLVVDTSRWWESELGEVGPERKAWVR